MNFGHAIYIYSENHGVVLDITIVLSNEIAQDFTVTVSGGIWFYMTILCFVTLGPGTQPSNIEVSGVNVNQSIKFTAHGAQSQGLPSFTIITDTVALETIEQYNLSFSNPSITNGLILGPGTVIRIIDDDGKKLSAILFIQNYVLQNLF